MMRVQGGCGLDDVRLGELAEKAADIEIPPEAVDYVSLRVEIAAGDVAGPETDGIGENHG